MKFDRFSDSVILSHWLETFSHNSHRSADEHWSHLNSQQETVTRLGRCGSSHASLPPALGISITSIISIELVWEVYSRISHSLQADLYMNITVCKLICTWKRQSMISLCSCWEVWKSMPLDEEAAKSTFTKVTLVNIVVNRTLVVLIPSGCWSCRNPCHGKHYLHPKGCYWKGKCTMICQGIMWACSQRAQGLQVLCCSWPFHILVWRSDCAHSRVEVRLQIALCGGLKLCHIDPFITTTTFSTFWRCHLNLTMRQSQEVGQP